MMNNRVLIVKTSSLGDVIHTLPALSDAAEAIDDVQFDWVIEDSYSEIPQWHPAVNSVIPVKLRSWRRAPIKTLFSDEWRRFKSLIAMNDYDAVIDAQGLLKSAILLPKTTGPSFGLDNKSAREPIASWFYDNKIYVPKNLHAVERTRRLFAKSLNYNIPEAMGRYGIQNNFKGSDVKPYIVLMHGTTWESKHYPEAYWHGIIKAALNENIQIKLLWGDKVEYSRANRLAGDNDSIEVMPKMRLADIASLLASAQGAIAVDTGLGHLAAAVECPTISLFTSTNPGLSGAYGSSQKHLYADYHCAPCMKRVCIEPAKTQSISGEKISITPPCATTIPPDIVWKSFMELTQSL